MPLAAEEFVADYLVRDDLVLGVALEASRIGPWEVVPCDADAVIQRLALISLTQPECLRLAAINLPEGISHLVSTEFDAECMSVASTSMDEEAFVGASRVLQGKVSPWIDFRREALPPRDSYRDVRRPLQFAMASAVLLLVAGAAALLVRAQHFEEQTQGYQEQQSKLSKGRAAHRARGKGK